MPHYPILSESGQTTVTVCGRVYTWENSILPTSVMIGGEEILAAPMRVIARSGGAEFAYTSARTFAINDTDSDGNDAVTIASAAEESCLILNTTARIEEDGCVDVSISVMPQGLSVAEVFGLEKRERPIPHLDRLWLEIPLRRSAARYYHVFPFGGLHGAFPADTKPQLSYAGEIPAGGFHCAFKEQLYLGNDACGIGLFFESRRGFAINDPDHTFEVVEDGDAVIVRIRLIDRLPDEWQNPEQSPLNLPPLSFRFGMQTTPVKKFPENPFTERALHIDCFKKILIDYEDFLSHPVVEGDDEIGYDRIKRLGVNTLYIHEKWNDMQNSPLLTTKTSARLSCIVDECHKRGIRVIPYFGYEISSLSPYFARFGEEFMCKTQPKPTRPGGWYRQPPQRDLRVCYASGWRKIFTDGLKNLIEKYNLDGLYLDTTVSPTGCYNTSHGCGFNDNSGATIPKHPVWELRSMMRDLYKFVDARGGRINVHGYGAFNLGCMAWCHSLWEGETFQSLFLNGQLSSMPEAHLRAQFTGRNIGIPVWSLCYSNPPVWTFRSAATFALIHGSLPKSNDIGEPLEIMETIWKILDDFPIAGAAWHPYYREAALKASADGVKVSYFENGGEILAVAGSTSTGFSGECSIDFTTIGARVVTDAQSGETLCENGIVTLRFDGIDFIFLRAKRESVD